MLSISPCISWVTNISISQYPYRGTYGMAGTSTKKKIVRREYTASDIKLLKTHSKATPVLKLTKLMKRSEGSLRQKALTLGIGLGHQR